jgi:hypothetical protein
MQDSLLNRRQAVRLGPEVDLAQTGIIGFDGPIELEAMRLHGPPEDAPAVFIACPLFRSGRGTSWQRYPGTCRASPLP